MSAEPLLSYEFVLKLHCTLMENSANFCLWPMDGVRPVSVERTTLLASDPSLYNFHQVMSDTTGTNQHFNCVRAKVSKASSMLLGTITLWKSCRGNKTLWGSKKHGNKSQLNLKRQIYVIDFKEIKTHYIFLTKSTSQMAIRSVAVLLFDFPCFSSFYDLSLSTFPTMELW